jgi:hypothetical protein
VSGAATWFLDTGTGSHSFKLGREVFWEQAWEGYLQQVGASRLGSAPSSTSAATAKPR